MEISGKRWGTPRKLMGKPEDHLRETQHGNRGETWKIQWKTIGALTWIRRTTSTARSFWPWARKLDYRIGGRVAERFANLCMETAEADTDIAHKRLLYIGYIPRSSGGR